MSLLDTNFTMELVPVTPEGTMRAIIWEKSPDVDGKKFITDIIEIDAHHWFCPEAAAAFLLGQAWKKICNAPSGRKFRARKE